ncbi:MAG: hypothetical protein WCS37_12495 [Chloroflexota bacterium]|nr:hypothetical protein [Chloroflexota bacterium]
MEQIAPFIFPSYVFLQLLQLVWTFRLARLITRLDLALLVIIQVAIFYDNSAMVLGLLLKADATLEMINSARFLLHSFLAPSLIVLATRILLDTLKEAKETANRQKYEKIAWIVAVAVSLFWTGANFFIVLKLAPLGAVQRYTMNRDLTPLWIFLLTPAAISLITVYIAVVGIFVWRKLKSAWLLVAAALMLGIGGAFPASTSAIPITNGAELIFVFGLLFTELKISKSKESP